jgi:hypothetical protein
MRHALALTLALSTFTSAALADEDSNAYNRPGLRPFIGAGYTWGGDTLIPVTVTIKGTSTQYKEDISGGAGLDLRFGFSYRFAAAPLSVQASYGYHNDQVNGIDNDSSFFRRYPLELLLQWHTTERTRVGLGVRRTQRATLGLRGGTCTYTDPTTGERETRACDDFHGRMSSTTGLILDGEYDVTPNWGLKARYVHEDYKFKGDPENTKYSGSHIGLLTVYYFN